MATKNYMINDKWLDLDKQNIVELQSVDGVLDSLKVNGSEIETPSGKITITENGTDIDIAQYATADVSVEGGGGSSDFSTAQVTITNTSEKGFRLEFPNFYEDVMYSYLDSADIDGSAITVALYKGECQVGFASEYPDTDFNITVSGNVEMVVDVPVIKGNGTITIS